MEIKSGFIAVLGAPNVGKSSLINALVGEKVSIVSPKAQTTRDRIMGIFSDDECQMVFVDTPGVLKPKNRLGEYMEKCIKAGSEGCDAIVIVLDAGKGIRQTDLDFIQKHVGKAPVYVALNKTDLGGFDKVYPLLTRLSPLLKSDEQDGIEEIVPTSAKKGTNVETLKNLLKKHLNDNVLYFDSEDLSDKPVSFMIAEIIREKTLWLLNDEIPHGIGVIIQQIKDEKKLFTVEADIVCEKDSHKEIIIGEGGSMLKEIGTKARADIEKLVDKKVFIKIFVKVRKDWRNRPSIINDLGYKS